MRVKKEMIMKKAVLFIFSLAALLASCGDQSNAQKNAFEFKNWNECEALTSLTAYVEKAIDKKSDNYIEVEDRIAVFDMDGTLSPRISAPAITSTKTASRCPCVTPMPKRKPSPA